MSLVDLISLPRVSLLSSKFSNFLTFNQVDLFLSVPFRYTFVNPDKKNQVFASSKEGFGRNDHFSQCCCPFTYVMIYDGVRCKLYLV